jgi:hypothetical protein
MAVPANTRQVYTQPNIREDLSNKIFNVDPYRTPVLNSIGRTKATQTLHEWDTDSLAAQNLANAQLEGDDAAADVLGEPTRLGNYSQISRKVLSLSGTSQQAVAAGGSNKMGYQLLKASKALKRDIEGIITYNNPKAVGAAGVARNTGGLPCWLITNTVFQTGGTPSGANPTDGSGSHARVYNSVKVALTEDQVGQLATSMYTHSGEAPEYLFVSPTNKRNVSKFTGPSGTRFNQIEDKVLRTAIDQYETDFGLVKVVPDIFLAQSGDCLALNPQYLKIAFFRPFDTVPLAKTGDSDKKMLIVEYALEVGNEKAEGAIFDTQG